MSEFGVEKRDFPRLATFCFLFSGQTCLLLKRNFPPFQGFWTPVGGKFKPGESPRQAILREVQEEVGLAASELQQLQCLGSLNEQGPYEHWQSWVYRAEVAHFLPPVCPEGLLAWQPLVALDKLPMPQVDKLILPAVLAGQSLAWSLVYNEKGRLATALNERNNQIFTF